MRGGAGFSALPGGTVPISYAIDRERGILEVTVHGAFTSADFATYFALRDADPEYTHNLDAVVDARAVTSVMAPSAFRYFGTETRLKPRIPSRRAIVANSDAVFGSAKIFEAHAEGSGPVYRVFRDMAAARAWLAECRTTAAEPELRHAAT